MDCPTINRQALQQRKTDPVRILKGIQSKVNFIAVKVVNIETPDIIVMTILKFERGGFSIQ